MYDTNAIQVNDEVGEEMKKARMFCCCCGWFDCFAVAVLLFGEQSKSQKDVERGRDAEKATTIDHKLSFYI